MHQGGRGGSEKKKIFNDERGEGGVKQKVNSCEEGGDESWSKLIV